MPVAEFYLKCVHEAFREVETQLMDAELPPGSWSVGLGGLGLFVVGWAGHVVGGVWPLWVVPCVGPVGDVFRA